ncbi:helix-turn-helix domain-containing protein [Fibrobacter sp.]|uniref:helix-turn-helix domain-containing protein n=1 Tax=Fibrobacter sp. TaxID=35828 RepID=UPI0025BEDC83|nr:helix-turn-helix domain-containing protein [Fibrobacter sp.]MBS7271314.1 helix-turn-helix domain-containing protein [Fibrobacter sp.]MCI6437231.1 helix-turn-helix domain-containing protein [Fibrobacter sp.]MDD7498213.1 helix-turn-helix domain-containing protein [Fibrobacter sp.]MDY5724587.1 helix-turn-helix domain-containing protein [Fibrobacter sp.]
MSNPAEKSPDEKLGAFIARVREERGMSVEELSAATKVSVAYIKSIEAGDWKAFPVAAYVRGYLHSISNKLNLNQQQVLKAYNAESGAPVQNDFEDVSGGQKLAPLKDGEIKKKSMAVPVVLVLLVLAFLVASHFLDLESLATKQSSEQQPAENVPAAVEDLMTQEIPDGAEAVPVDSLGSDSAAKDSAVDRFAVDVTVSQAVVDEAVKNSDLPASATIFISSDSKKDSVAVEEAPKTKKTNFLLVGSGEALSWVGLKRREDSNSFLKEANISRAGVKMVYNTNDTLCVTIGEPKAIAKMYLNGVETPLPEMKFGRVTRFRVFGGRIVK